MNPDSVQKTQGTISVNTENIFPIIKRSLYADHEIFLRELISNALDATQKIKYLSNSSTFLGELGDLNITVTVDKEAKTLTVSDKGVGMTEEEVHKYINQVAFSGAEEFVKKFKEVKDSNEIIGRFGLGFYSAFMVSTKVEIQTLSFEENAVPILWECDGSTSYSMTQGSRTERGTDIILHIDADSEEFLETERVRHILTKYFRFVPTPIELDGEILNPTPPLWNKKPAEIEDEEYLAFYKELYPYNEEPLFWIHLNIDLPFNLTGILYFPKIKREIDPNRNKIQLYSRQVFITDEVKEVVPDYLMLLQGVLDSPDIPLNVSRSYLQSDANVKRISGYITRKVGDKLTEIFKEDRTKFEEKWKDISLFVKYGMITDEKFDEKAEKFFLIENTSQHLFTLEEYKDKVAPLQTNKEGELVFLYTNDAEKQDLLIGQAQQKHYDVVVMDGMLDNHIVGHLERKMEKSRWARIDSETLDKLISKETEETPTETLSETEQTELKSLFDKVANNSLYQFQTQNMGQEQLPIVIVRNEWMRRMQEMSAMNGGGMGFNFPETLQIMLNTAHPAVQKIATSPNETTAKQLLDLALLTQDMLKGKALSDFIQRTISNM